MVNQTGIEKLKSHTLCWWFGHKQEKYGYACERCGLWDIPLSETRHNRLTGFFYWYCFRKWFPEKCKTCGGRYKCTCGDMPPF